ncbi:hypothetical protein [Enterobacter cloacae]|uniref:hypothetical protein n=1 Tax=Enterobacter cloacae TaxID=550 RepID=UPI0025505C9E|nr:hypothetical protein [Enterobacter cloacae]MDV5631292.1 hypothetical protein [Enterobacter cloacae]MDV5669263.1 hypothetical protein [Enterobacter cloacae]
MDAEVLDMLMIYDAYIEPSGIHIEMLKHAYQCYYSSLNSSTLTPEAKKKLKVSDYDFLDVLNPTLSTREKEEKRKAIVEENQTNSISSIGEAIKKEAMRKNNGKK